MKKKLAGIIIMLILCCLDQLSKWWAIVTLKDQEDITVIDNVLTFSYLENRGAAFGSFTGMRVFLIAITFVVLGVLLWKYFQIPVMKRYLCMRTCILCLIAGTVGNLIDRVIRAFVVDFIYFVPIDFPKFNIADCYIVVSVIVLAIAIFIYYDDSDFENLMSIKNGWKSQEE